jgi:hypothetical protein
MEFLSRPGVKDGLPPDVWLVRIHRGVAPYTFAEVAPDMKPLRAVSLRVPSRI